MANYYQNQGYGQETAPTEHLQQRFGFPPAYEQRIPPPYPGGDEYSRQPATAPPAPYPIGPPPQLFSAHVHAEPPRVVYVGQSPPVARAHWCAKLCFECVCAIVSSLVYTVLGIVLFVVAVGLIVYFAKFYKH